MGEIDEIVILDKKDWRGKKYGFVRFVDVKNERMEETKLNNTWLNGRIISANISKYKRSVVNRASADHVVFKREEEAIKKDSGRFE